MVGELSTQSLEIVDLAVVRDDVAPGFGDHRLVAERREVQDREAPVPQRNSRRSIRPYALIIRPTVRERIRHSSTRRRQRFGWRRTREVENARQPAHGAGLP